MTPRAVCVALSAAVCLLLAGCGSLPPLPGSEPPAASTAPVGGPPPVEEMRVIPPVAIEIPSIDARSTLIPTGLEADGTAEVVPTDQPLQASYLDWSDDIELERPLAVYGHVDGNDGRGNSVPGVFVDLKNVQLGAEIIVVYEDGVREVFRVTEVEKIDKDAFPSAKVYDIRPQREIRVITCTGLFDRSVRSYEDNFIVYGEKIS